MRDKHCFALINELNETEKALQAIFEKSINSNESEFLIPKIKNFLENCRSILEYVTQDIFETVIPEKKRNEKKLSKRPNVYFPYAAKKTDFDISVNRNLPGLDRVSKEYRMILNLQDFKRSDSQKFLTLMCRLTNANKHDMLSHTRKISDEKMQLGQSIYIGNPSNFNISFINSEIDGVNTGSLNINQGHVSGEVNPDILELIHFEKGHLVFSDLDKRVDSFLFYCKNEIIKFVEGFYSISKN
ncbi:hypothetical protein MKX54_10940 [Alkalihalobacillus sp. FSL R5-0424]